MQEAFAAHLRHVGRTYPRGQYRRVVLTLENAPWHRGGPSDAALADNPHVDYYRLPSYSPHVNPIERFWKKPRRRAIHNHLFEALANLKRSRRASLGYFQTRRNRVKSIIEGRPQRKAPALGVHIKRRRRAVAVPPAARPRQSRARHGQLVLAGQCSHQLRVFCGQ